MHTSFQYTNHPKKSTIITRIAYLKEKEPRRGDIIELGNMHELTSKKGSKEEGT